MFLPSTEPRSPRVNCWNQEAPAAWPSASTITGGIAGDTLGQGRRLPSLNRVKSGSIYVRGSTSSCEIRAEATPNGYINHKGGIAV